MTCVNYYRFPLLVSLLSGLALGGCRPARPPAHGGAGGSSGSSSSSSSTGGSADSSSSTSSGGGSTGSTSSSTENCGKAGDPCCSGNQCDNGGCCDSNTCVAVGNTCGGGGLCAGGNCAGCGELNSPCCASTPKCKAGGQCASNTCVKCGGLGDSCCADDTCDNGCCTGGSCVAKPASGDCTSSPADASSGGQDTSSTGCAGATATPCTGLPAFSGTQTLDGKDDDFCNVPSFELNFKNAARVKEYNTGGANSVERVLARVAWDSVGIHAFIHVIDPKFVPAADLANIWNADGIELLFSSTTAGLKGGTADDAAVTTHVIVSPPLAARSKSSGANGSQEALAANLYVASVVSDGYQVELNLPWPGTPPSAGAQIKFDMEINAADGKSTNGDAGPRDAQAMLFQGTISGGSSCGSDAFPYCDDRLWCSTTLQ
ncbi:MAG TPA: hypothetical protein VF518_11300 [Polyangia bacterium]